MLPSEVAENTARKYFGNLMMGWGIDENGKFSLTLRSPWDTFEKTVKEFNKVNSKLFALNTKIEKIDIIKKKIEDTANLYAQKIKEKIINQEEEFNENLQQQKTELNNIANEYKQELGELYGKEKEKLESDGSNFQKELELDEERIKDITLKVVYKKISEEVDKIIKEEKLEIKRKLNEMLKGITERAEKQIREQIKKKIEGESQDKKEEEIYG